jgi:flagellar secretion chaperone FliS
MSFAAAQYRMARVETASPVQIVVQLYDAAIRSLEQASKGIANRSPLVNSHLGKASQIISELEVSLDRRYAPELCTELSRIYEFAIYRINQACISPKPETIAPVIKVLKDLRGAWDELARTKR